MTQRAFDHILIIMLENQYRGYVKNNTYFNNLAKQGIELTNSFGVMHPSQTNYISAISGELCNVTDDDRPAPLKQRTIVDLIEESPQNLDWRAYMDSYIAGANPWTPDNFVPKDRYPYMIKHNPFSSYENIITNQERWQKVVNEADFFSDLLNGQLPNYAWFTPNMWNDGHYLVGTGADSLEGVGGSDLKGERAPVLVDQQAQWLESFFGKLKFPGPDSLLPKNTLVVVTYDEADFEAKYDKHDKYFYDGPNQIYTVLLGDTIQPGQQHEGYNHYSLLKTVEKNFNLDTLGKNDEHANWFRFLWQESFNWQTTDTQLEVSADQLSSCQYQSQLWQFALQSNGQILVTVQAESAQLKQPQPSLQWQPLVIDNQPVTACQLTVTANEHGIYLFTSNNNGQLSTWLFTPSSGWQSTTSPALSDATRLSATALPTDGSLYLVAQQASGALSSSCLPANESPANQTSSQEWQPPQAITAATTTGQFALTTQGSTLFLIYQHKHTNALCAVTYNTATFNQTTVESSSYAGPNDNASMSQWSPSAIPLKHYSEGYSAITPTEPEPTSNCYKGDGVLVASCLDGVVHVVHNAPDSTQLITETFSIPGVLTPANPVSYDPTKESSTSNAYGTLDQAGWSQQTPLANACKNPHDAMSLTTLNDKLVLSYLDDGKVKVVLGGY